MAGPERVAFTVGADDVGRRVDQVLAARVPELSRTQARVLLDIGGVFVDGRRVKVASRAVRAGEEVIAVMGGAFSRATKRPGREARAEDERRLPAYAIVFEDQDLVVVEKPAGLLTAPTPESDRNNLAMLLSRRAGAGGSDVFVVHRIDLETSGLVVFAKTAHANRVLAEKFRTHDIERAYLAVVAGRFPEDVSRIAQPVGGRPAVTRVTIRESLGPLATLLECRLETGRTHQIRLHATALGHPVIGDAKYGVPFRAAPAPRMALHATTLGFGHPRSGAPLSFQSPLPVELVDWIDRVRRLAVAAVQGVGASDVLPDGGAP
jgi:23S rRNA pseudouridine1911/1915/1917 synthase